MTISKKPPKIGKHYRAIVEKGCLADMKFGCSHGYTWECDDCPCVMEEIKIAKARLNSLGNFNKQCRKCHTTLFVKDNFYIREIDKYGFPQHDSICKQCADKQNFLYKVKPIKKKSKTVKDWGIFKRSTREGFKFYMQQNPYYFTSIFQKECTDANIEYEFNLLDILNDNKRPTKDEFGFYMKKNPHHFTSIFQKECSDENIELEFKSFKKRKRG